MQYDRLGTVTRLLRQVARAWGGNDGSVAGRWAALLASLSRGRATTGDVTPGGADQARHRLARMLARFDGSHALVIQLAEGRLPPLVSHVLEGRLTRRDQNQLARLRDGLDRI